MAYNFPPNPTLNQVYSYNGKTFKWNGVQWVVTSAATSTTAPVFVSSSPPSSPIVGYLWFNTLDSTLYVRVETPSGESWEPASSDAPSPPVSGQVIVSASPPANPVVGLLWFNTVDNVLYIRVETPSGGFWESSCNYIPPPSDKAQVVVSASPPNNPPTGLLWFNTVDNNLYVRVQSPEGGFWTISNDSALPVPKPTVTVSSSPPEDPSSGDLWFDPDNSNLSIWYNDIDSGQWVVIPYAGGMMTVDGGTFTGPIYAEYDIPDEPNAFVTAEWVTERVESNVPKSLLSGKGSLITATAAGTPVELQAGTSGQFLKVDPTVDKGLSWSNDVDCGAF